VVKRVLIDASDIENGSLIFFTRISLKKITILIKKSRYKKKSYPESILLILISTDEREINIFYFFNLPFQ